MNSVLTAKGIKSALKTSDHCITKLMVVLGLTTDAGYVCVGRGGVESYLVSVSTMSAKCNLLCNQALVSGS